MSKQELKDIQIWPLKYGLFFMDQVMKIKNSGYHCLTTGVNKVLCYSAT